MILVIGICIQINTIKSATENVGITLKDNSDLKEELLRVQGTYETLYKSLEKAEEQLTDVRQEASHNNEEDIQNEEKIKNNKVLLGLTEVSGKGLIIRLDENRNIKSEEVINISDYLVHEQDIIAIIHEIFNVGADAISINNQRIINTTGIACDGNIIRINGQMVGVPITIKAIGYPEEIEGALLRPGGYLQKMANDGVIVTIERSENITIPKYEGTYSYEYILKGD